MGGRECPELEFSLPVRVGRESNEKAECWFLSSSASLENMNRVIISTIKLFPKWVPRTVSHGIFWPFAVVKRPSFSEAEWLWAFPQITAAGDRVKEDCTERRGSYNSGSWGLRGGQPSSCPRGGGALWSRGECGSELEPGEPGLIRAPSANLSLEGYPLPGPVLRVMPTMQGGSFDRWLFLFGSGDEG